MSDKQTKESNNRSVWRWYIAFDNLDTYKKVVDGLIEANQFQGGEMHTCPDGQLRMTIEVKKELVNQLQTAQIGGDRVRFLTMIKSDPNAPFEFVPTSNDNKGIRVSKQTFDVIKGSSLLRRHQRQARKTTA